MKISQEVREHAAQMTQMSATFRTYGSELYHSLEVITDDKLA